VHYEIKGPKQLVQAASQAARAGVVKNAPIRAQIKMRGIFGL